MGLAPINHTQRFEAMLKDRQYDQDQLYKLKKDFRAKEQEYETKLAVQQQKIELLEIKVKEAEEREVT